MKIKISLTTILLLLGFTMVKAQNSTISGTVTDRNGLPLPGVSIVILGTTNGTQSDFDGKYSIVADTGQTLQFSYVGQKMVNLTIGNSNVINVQMEEDAQALDEVIVTGQGAGIRRRKLSTTVDVLTEEKIDKLPANQIDQLLQATAPSAQIRLSSGQPGTASIIRTRGPISAASSSTPVIIVDGVRVDNLNSNPTLGINTGGANVSALADIPVESIERIEYIKGGAATTLYGADAANGIIQIITKKGKSGKGTAFFESRLGVIDATRDFLKYERTGDAIFEPGFSQEFRVGFNGGNENFTYNFGGSLYKDDGFNDLNEQVRRTFTFGLSAKVTDKLKYQGSFSYVSFDSNLDYNANTSFSRFANLEAGDFGNLDELTEDEWIPIRDNTRRIGELVDISSRTSRFTASNKFTYDITRTLQANATVGIDFRHTVQENLDSNKLLIALGSIPPGTTDQASFSRALRDNFIVTGDMNFTHRASTDNFSFVSVFGGQFFRTSDRQNRLDGEGGVDGTRKIDFFPTQNALDFVLENANYGLYFLENVGIYDVAYLEFGGRLDRSTASGSNTKPLLLPKVGFTYNLSDHSFYQEANISNWISNIRLRANYGEATNFATPFAQDRTFELSSFLGVPAFSFANPGNDDLISETVQTFEFGIDLGFFKNRLNLSGTRYVANTIDALFTPVAAPSRGSQNQLRNIGKVENKGWELELRAAILQSERHQMNLSVSYNQNENNVVDAGGSSPFVTGGFTVLGSVVAEGESLGFLRGTAAVLQDDGTYEFETNSFLGKTFAPNFGSFSLDYTFKDKLNLFLTGDYQFGGQITDLTFLLRHLGGVDNTGIPEELIGTTSPFNYVNFFIFDNDYLKIRNIGLSYNFGQLSPLFSNVRFGITVTNPFNFVKADADPEATGSGIALQNGFSSGGFAYGTESAPRIYMSSLKFQF